VSCRVSANEYSCTHKAQIKFGDLTPYLTYENQYHGRETSLYLATGLRASTIVIYVKILYDKNKLKRAA
jgi:hypothetical protein